MQRILIVDPSDTVRLGLTRRFNEAGFETLSAGDYQDALELLEGKPPSLALVDIHEERTEPLAFLKRLRDACPEAKVMAMTALGSADTAVAAMKLGAVDFLWKPFSPPEIIARAKQHLLDSRETASPLCPSPEENRLGKVIGRSPAIQNILHLIASISDSHKPVFISGESGVGKTMFARHIHETSHRASKPLFSLNCAAFSEEVFLESELFGYAERTSDGAHLTREGVLMKAQGGTLILEEVEAMPPGTQAKLLRYLQSGEIRRAGENTPINADTRIIATTKKTLKFFDDEDRMRTDLFFRLRSLALEIPPLRHRGEDIPTLIQHFLKQLQRPGKPSFRMDKEALSVLCSLPFPGNVLELKNLLEQITLVADREIIDPAVLERAGISREEEERGALQKVARAEREIIEQIIRKHPRDLDAAARELAVSRTTLWRRMKKYDMIARSRGSGADR